MKQPALIAEQLEASFNHIHLQQMQGIPILNPLIKVQALGFQEYQGRIIGIIITPWLMNVVMLPKDNEDWRQYQIGHKIPHEFPSNQYKFMVNEIEDIGYCQTYSIYSPMNEFANHEHALSAAQSFIDTMMVERDPRLEQPDEELFGRILRGEEQPELTMEELAILENNGETIVPIETTIVQVNVEKKLSRRDLIRGNFMTNS
ncbi:MAG: [NiFe]-hydrogenase assembly chaperone HybE [Pseudomonadota bacterium]